MGGGGWALTLSSSPFPLFPASLAVRGREKQRSQRSATHPTNAAATYDNNGLNDNEDANDYNDHQCIHDEER